MTGQQIDKHWVKHCKGLEFDLWAVSYVCFHHRPQKYRATFSSDTVRGKVLTHFEAFLSSLIWPKTLYSVTP